MANLDEHFVEYTYKNCPIPGGGFVTGYVFHPKAKNILYARTDIGGVYRFYFEKDLWISLIDHVKATEPAQTAPLSIALDPNAPSRIFIACGDNDYGVLAVSDDFGENFTYYPIPAVVNGNAPGRSSGERLLLVDNHLYFGSQTEGLLVANTTDFVWQKRDVRTAESETENHITFLYENQGILIVGTAGTANRVNENVRGQTLYATIDKGFSFTALQTPESYDDTRLGIRGFVPMRCVFDGDYYYITFTQNVGNHINCYASDTGMCFDGRIYRYRLNKNGKAISVDDITPKTNFFDGQNPARSFGSGLCGLDYKNGMLLLTSQQGADSDTIFASVDKGENWTKILHGIDIGIVDVDVSYMKTEYNGGTTVIHWTTDIKINPFDENHAVLTTGTGVFMTYNLRDWLNQRPVKFVSRTNGVEETVHLNVYSPPKGDVQLIDIVGDLGGFAFTDLDKQCENSFADENNHRYITCLNADFAEQNPFYVAATPRGNWTGRTKGGVILSHDQCKTWQRLIPPRYLSEKLNRCFDDIEKPNVDSGWVAVSADAKVILWAVSEKRRNPADCVIKTQDEGETWTVSNFHTKYPTDLSKLHVKVFSDRVNPDKFYAYSNDLRFFYSLDAGDNFYEIDVPETLKTDDSSRYWRRFELRVEPENEGVVWVALSEFGLWRIYFTGDTAEFEQVLSESTFCVGLGKPHELSTHKTLFINAVLGGEYGFYRSIDGGQSWERINTDKQMYGKISSISGDPRKFGRLYIATGSRGVLYGDMIL